MTAIITTDLEPQVIDDLAVGEELTDDELAMVAGAMRAEYIGKTFFGDGSVENDFLAVD